MSSCDHCGKFVLFGTRRGDRVYCGGRCATFDPLVTLAREIPEAQVRELVQRWRNEPCPRCKGAGPVDLHTSHKVHSFLVMTQWSSARLVACVSCGRRQQFGHLAYSLLLGWWGLPWGLLVTPIQVVRNLGGLVRPAGRERPSPAFERTVRRIMAQHAMDAAHQDSAA